MIRLLKRLSSGTVALSIFGSYCYGVTMKHKNKKKEESRDEDVDWRAVALSFQELHTLFNQEELRQEWERKDLINVLNCDVCKQWEEHFNFYPHSRIGAWERRRRMAP